MKKNYLILCLAFFAFVANAQQDAQYNLYQFNQMVINPAYAGARDGLSAVVSRRQQWVGFDGAPVTNCLSLHGPILKKNLGLGLTVVNDIMGPRNVFSVYGNVAYILKLNKKLKLSFGVNGGYNRYQFNFSKISFNTSEVPSTSYFAQNQNYNALDINSGLYLRANTFFVGLSATHLNTPNIYDYKVSDTSSSKLIYRLKTHLFLTAGKSFKLSEDVIFAPTILAKIVGTQYGADLNLNFFLFKKLWLGAFYRYGYGPGGLIQYYVTNKLRVAYSYDSGLGTQMKLGSSHEVMIGFDFSGKSNKSKVINPRFL